MKKQITRFSPHQNAKVFAILMAVSSLLFLVPITLIMYWLAWSSESAGSPPPFSVEGVLAVPVVYLVAGYVSVFIGCIVYNLLMPFLGGIEFELADED